MNTQTSLDQTAPASSLASNKQQRRLASIALAALAALGLAIAALGFPFGNQAGAADFGATIIDVRTAEEFAAGHIEGAVNIPLNSSDFRDQIEALDRGGDFILHCGTGARADRVAEFMVAEGFTGLRGSYSLEEALSLSGASVIGDLTLANTFNPTTNEDVVTADGPPTCALTGESLFGVTRG
ncbi:MAG: rhodanese-like domain-containing protein [Cellulomonadaceae bacterium]|jgi:rhodanese-related sulfurtransferase|nr:rhodanese-like domain-containing protein [Cellulomonadaceae bacterium]